MHDESQPLYFHDMASHIYFYALYALIWADIMSHQDKASSQQNDEDIHA